MRSWIVILLIAFAAAPALAQEARQASSDETSTADAAPVKPDPDAAADVAEARPFKIPPASGPRRVATRPCTVART